tara:strand:- start:1651 stop:2097 length:447 start_codon:yes stop_codon:yes gene_type:complete
MNKTKPIIAIFLILLYLNSCSSISEGLGGSKKKKTDEFLVEKKAPLALPPNFGELPKPIGKIDEDRNLTEENTSSIEKIVNQSSSTGANNKKIVPGSSIEKSIIEKINKKKIKKLFPEVATEVATEEAPETTKKKNFLQKLKEKISKK